VEHRLLAERAQDRELHRLWHERQPEVEVEDVRPRQQPRESAPLGELAAQEARRAAQVDVGFGVQPVAVEDDELRVDAELAQRLHVRPRDAGRVDRAVDDPQALYGDRYPRSNPSVTGAQTT